MSDHLPECFLSGRCSPDEPNHGFCGNSDFLWCMHCEKECICERIKRAEDRVRTENNEYRAMLGGIEFGAERSWDYALDAARDAVADARKWPAYLPPNAGDGLFVVITEADALNAIDALREQT